MAKKKIKIKKKSPKGKPVKKDARKHKKKSTKKRVTKRTKKIIAKTDKPTFNKAPTEPMGQQGHEDEVHEPGLYQEDIGTSVTDEAGKKDTDLENIDDEPA